MKANPAVDTIPKFPPWVWKVVGWLLISVMTLGTTAAVTKTRLDAIEANTKEQRKELQAADRDQVTQREFNQFKEDLNKRLDTEHQYLRERLDRIEDATKHKH